MTLLATLTGYTMALPLLATALLIVAVDYVLGRRTRLDRLLRGLTRVCLLAFGIRVRCAGPRRPDEAGIYVANHVSIFDPLVLHLSLPKGTRGVELEDHFDWPIWGSIARMMGNIPISHRNTRSAVESLDRAAAVVRAGTPLVILPEGHRTRDGRLGRFMRGPFYLARRTRAPIVPIALRGLYERKCVHSLRVSPGVVTVAFGRPIEPREYEELGERAIARLVRGAIERLLA